MTTLQMVLAISRHSEESFIQLNVRYVNDILNPTRQVQHARLIARTKTNGMNSATKPTNEDEWIVKKGKSKKKQGQVGKINKINRFDKTG